LPAIIEQVNELDHKRNEKVVAGVGMMNFPMVNKSVTAKELKIEIVLAASLSWYCSTSAVNRLRETIERH